MARSARQVSEGATSFDAEARVDLPDFEALRDLPDRPEDRLFVPLLER